MICWFTSMASTYASVDVELDERLSLTEAHNIIDSIETALLEQQNVNLSIHLDPVNLEDLKLLEGGSSYY